MDNKNLFQIQEMLLREGMVSIPQLQQLLQIEYKEARSLMESLVQKKWVTAPEQGLMYTACRENMRLRRLCEDEVDGLLQSITADCISVLDCLKENNDLGCLRRELEIAVHGRLDTLKACQMLMRYKLIYKQEERYFLAVSPETVEVLMEAFERMQALEGLSDKRKRAEEMQRICSLFDKLFSCT